MSDIIRPGIVMPENVDREFWLKGKPTRQEVLTEVASSIAEIQVALNGQLQRMGNGMSQAFNMVRILGQQLETLVRMMDMAVPGFRENFKVEVVKTMKMVEFLDTIMTPGEHSAKPIKQRIQYVKDWNAQENVVKIMGEHWRLDEYINEHNNEFTAEEIEDLNKEFNMTCVKMVTPPVTQEEVPNVAGKPTEEERAGVERLPKEPAETVVNV